MALFRPPAALDDFALRPARREALAKGWDAIVDNWFTEYAGTEGGRFYNPRSDTTPGEAETASVAWDAFPRPLTKWFEEEDDRDLKRWRAADTLRPRTFGGRPLRRLINDRLGDPFEVFYRQQDEYCEWFVHRDAGNRITKVTFTCEVPEYWRFLAGGTAEFFSDDDDRSRIVDGDLSLVVELYKRWVDPSVTAEDLVWPFDVAAFDTRTGQWQRYGRAGSYNPFNKWTTTHGAMHLTHPANTLEGEVRVAARAAVLRKDGRGRPVDDAEALVCCTGFGEPNRSSDPAIGGAVNGLVRDGFSVSLADPVGLYIAGINGDAFSGPRGAGAVNTWRVDRGDGEQQRIVRATFAPPPRARYTVDKMRAGGTPVAYGGQIADEVQMILTGLAKRRTSQPPARRPCVTKCCEHPSRVGVQTVVGLGVNCAGVDWTTRAPVS